MSEKDNYPKFDMNQSRKKHQRPLHDELVILQKQTEQTNGWTEIEPTNKPQKLFILISSQSSFEYGAGFLYVIVSKTVICLSLFHFITLFLVDLVAYICY